MNKKVMGIVAAIVIIVGIVVTAILDVNSDLIYRAHKELDINIGKEFDNKDIQTIVKDSTDGKEVLVSKVELYQDMANIKIEDITEEQIEKINSKINEKYTIDNKTEDIIVTNIPRVSGFDLLKPYILPTIISFVLIVAFQIICLVIKKKNNQEEAEIKIPKSVLELVISIIGVELVYFSVIAITRFPINGFVIPIAVLLFIITAGAQFIKK